MEKIIEETKSVLPYIFIISKFVAMNQMQKCFSFLKVITKNFI